MKNSNFFSQYKVSFLLLFIVLFSQCQNENNWDNKTILVTAPSIYNERLSTHINSTGMKAIPFPVIETNLIDNNGEIDSILIHLDNFDWISLTSRNAIKAFIKRAGELDIPLKELQEQSYCAIGKDQDLLRSFGLDSIVDNLESSPQGILEALKKLECNKKKIAVFAPLVVGISEPDVIPNYIDSLENAGIIVTKVNAYTTNLCSPDNENNVRYKINKGNIDLIAFTSTGEILALLELVGGSEKLSETAIACFGPYTYKNALKLGLKPSFMAKDFSSFEGYVESMTDYFVKKNSEQLKD